MSEIEGQGSLLEAQRQADRAVERVKEHADPEALDYWLTVVWAVARKYEEFSTNKIMEAARGDTLPLVLGKAKELLEPRAMGAVMRRAQRLGVIRPTDRFEPDRSPGAHARPKRVWRSLLYRGRES